MDRQSLDQLVMTAPEAQSIAMQSEIVRLAMIGVDDDALRAVSKALTRAIPPRTHNPFAAIDPNRSVSEAVYSGKYMLVHLLEIECARRAKPNADHV